MRAVAVHTLAFLAFLFLAAFSSSGCATAAARAEDRLVQATDASIAAYEDLDEAEQQRCVDVATSRAEGKTCLASWRAKRKPAKDLVLAIRGAVLRQEGSTKIAPLAARLTEAVNVLRAEVH